MLLTKTINGIEIAYTDSGFAEGPAIVMFTGWAHDISLFDPLVPYLAFKHRVITICWRGHGPSRDPIEDFGVKEQFDDSMALLKELEVDQFYLISHSHGGWVALEVADQVGKGRVLGVLMLDQIMTPAPSGFIDDLHAMQSKSLWRAARKNLFDSWTANSTNCKPLMDHIIYSLSSFGYDMWALSCRVIFSAYSAHTSPMGRMEKFNPSLTNNDSPPPIRHIFSHPLNNPSYRELHEKFAESHPWFSWTDLKGGTHFPSLEVPERVAEQLEDLIKKSSS